MNTRTKTRIPKMKLARKARALVDPDGAGLTRKEAAKRLGVSERYVYELLKHADAEGTAAVVVIPDPVDPSTMPSDVRALLEWRPEAFIAFFNRFSGMTMAPHNEAMVYEVFADPEEWILLNVPPRHAKSEIFAVWFPIWLIARDRNVQILLGSKTRDQAMKHARKIAHILEYHQELVRLFGRFKPDSADWPWRPQIGELMVEGRDRAVQSGDLTLQVRGAGQGILGMAAHFLIADDVADKDSVNTPKQREDLSEWYHDEFLTRREPGAKVIVIGQRLHPMDLYGQLSQKRWTNPATGEEAPVYRLIKFPAILNYEKKILLWPEGRFSFEELMKMRASMGSAAFECMYQQNPAAMGEALAKLEWFHGDEEKGHPGCLDYDRMVGQGLREDPEHQKGIIPILRVLSIDPSPTAYAGVTLADVPYIKGGQGHEFFGAILEQVLERMGPREMIQTLERVWEMYGPIDYLIFEKNAAQRWFLRDTALQPWRKKLRIIPHETGRNKGHPELGIGSLAADIEFGRIRFPYGDANAREMTQTFIEEATSWPHGDHDDLLMSTWFIRFNRAHLLPQQSSSRARSRRSLPPRLQGGYRFMQRRR